MSGKRFLQCCAALPIVVPWAILAIVPQATVQRDTVGYYVAGALVGSAIGSLILYVPFAVTVLFLLRNRSEDTHRHVALWVPFMFLPIVWVFLWATSASQEQ